VGLDATTSKFESAVMQHMDAAYNLARWLTRNDQDAQDIVQESCMRALRAFDSLRGQDFRPWFLAIVRNASFTLLRRRKDSSSSADESLETTPEVAADSEAFDPQAIAIRAADVDLVRRAIAALPDALRETLILREMEGLGYKEIGKIVGVPIGTVMSRLARGRARLQTLLVEMEKAAPVKPAREGQP